MTSNVFQRLPLERFRSVVQESTSISQVFVKLGLCKSSEQYKPFRQAVQDLDIDISHFRGQYQTGQPFSPTLPDEQVFVRDSLACATTVKRILKRKSLIPYVCAPCQNAGTWLDKPLSLQLDHLNGENDDHRLENLRWLCPNCHSQTPTFCGRNTRKRLCPDCQRPSSGVGVRCRKCHGRSVRISDWPSAESFKVLVWEAPLWKLEQKLGHSRNDIRDHCKEIGVEIPPRGYWQKRASGQSHEEATYIKVKTPKRAMSPEDVTRIHRLKQEGHSNREISRIVGFHHTNVGRLLNGASPGSRTPTLDVEQPQATVKPQ